MPFISSNIFDTSVGYIFSFTTFIFNPKLNLAIEYNGRQHYEPVEIFGGEVEFEKRKILDNKKKDLLAKHNCTLYIIKYNYNEKH